MESFQVFLIPYYLPIKAIHIIAIISWMAAMLYLPRLFVYHATAPLGGDFSNNLKVMEYRLAKYIMTPAMIVSILFGLLLVCVPGAIAKPNMWFHAKMLFVLGLCGLHGYFIKTMRLFAADVRPKSPLFFRIINEAVTLFMIAIVFLVVLKSF